MPVYLETSALRKLTSYRCKETTYTSIFSIFELLSGITQKDFEIRKACLKRIKDQKLIIKGPMIDKLFMKLVGVTEDGMYNEQTYTMLKNAWNIALKAKSYSAFSNTTLNDNEDKGKDHKIHILTWLEHWDAGISSITKNLDRLFADENREYIKSKYAKDGIKGLADYFWEKYYDNRTDEGRLAHAEAFVGADAIKKVRQEADDLFAKYNFNLFIKAQAAIFSKAFFIDGNSQNANNASDLLHLLYLDEHDKFVSNDKIYQTIFEACPDFNLIVLGNEKDLSNLI